MSIHRLPAEVVDKIAAGEVLERPANLLKELIENSIDAGATELEIEFDRGGRDVRVQDNGRGIVKSELALALERHATSKIVQSEDLYQLTTFGFRGEALSSIAAVSDFQITSRRHNQAEAYRLNSRFGQADEPLLTSAQEGTEVRIKDLFENVPARLRFLKSEAAEHTQIKTTLKALALANENVSFRVRSRGELVFHWPVTADFKKRAEDVLQVEDLYAGEYAVDGVIAEVLVSSPLKTQNVNRNLWFFVQGRWVQDRALSAAVMEGYRNLLMHGEYPMAVVRLRLAPEDVDVNVHPTKAQVKFREPQAAFRATCRAVRQVLEGSPWLKPGESFKPTFEAVTLESVTSKQSNAAESTDLAFRAPEFERVQYASKAFPLSQIRELAGPYQVQPSEYALSAKTHATAGDANAGDADAAAKLFRWRDLHVIGQLNHTYIVAQTGEDMYLVDQHAAHERVVFERLLDSYQTKTIDVQNLLLPLVFDFSAHEVEVLTEHRAGIERLGLSLERMGPESIAVQAIPSLITESGVSEALKKLAYELTQNSESLAFQKAVNEIFASMACHSVIRAGQSQSIEQMRSLLEQMDDYPLSSFCPHGRPVFVRRRFHEIEREFGRIV